MNLSSFFIDRPIFAGVLSMLIFLAGAASRCACMPISEYPEVVPPSVVVRAHYPGANPKVIAETVATPLEEAINGVEDMLYMSSQATTDGLMTLTVTFRLGTDPDKAQQLVQNRVAQAEPRLPEEVRRLGVTTVKSSPDLTMVVHLLSPNDRYDMTYLRNYAVLNVKDRLARIEGVGQVQLFGARRLFDARLARSAEGRASAASRPSDVVRAIREQNVQAAAGVVGASPGAAGRRPAALDQRAGPACRPRRSSATSSSRRGANGAVTRLRDVARIELGAAEYALRSLLDNKPAVAIGIFQAPGSNALAISDNVRKTMAELKHEHAGGRRLRDRLRPDAVRARLDRGRGAHAARGGGAGRAGRDPVPADLARLDHPAARRAGLDHRHVRGDVRCSASRSTRCRCSAWCSRSASSSTTRSSWSRTSSATSRRACRRARRPTRRCARCPGRSSPSRWCSIAVFVPLAFISGLTGPVLQAVRADDRDLDGDLGDQLADALAGAGGAAAQGATTRRKDRADARHGPRVRLVLPRLQQRVPARHAGLRRRRARASSRARRVMMGVYVVLVGVTFGAVQDGAAAASCRRQDKQYLVGFAQLPDGATLDRTEDVIRRMSEIALKHPGVENAVAFPGLSINGFTNSSNAGIVFVTLKPFEERKSADLSGGAIAMQLNQKFGAIQDALHRHVPAAAGAWASAPSAASSCRSRTAPALGYEALDDATKAFLAKALADAGARRPVLELPGQRAAALRRRRPHQGAPARRAGDRRVRHACRSISARST